MVVAGHQPRMLAPGTCVRLAPPSPIPALTDRVASGTNRRLGRGSLSAPARLADDVRDAYYGLRAVYAR